MAVGGNKLFDRIVWIFYRTAILKQTEIIWGGIWETSGVSYSGNYAAKVSRI